MMDSFILIPMEIVKNSKLSSTSKLLFGCLLSLTKKDGFCYASNKYLSNMLNVSTRTISRLLKGLEEEKVIDFKYTDTNKRNIYIRKKFLY